MRKLLLLLLCCNALPVWLAAQEKKAPLPYAYVREADITWSKRIWCVIDLKEKTNLPFYFPMQPSVSRFSLFDILKKGVFTGTIKAFDSDEFIKPLDSSAITQLLVKNNSITEYSAGQEGEELEFNKLVKDTLVSTGIVQYWLKEDWFFDKQRSVMDVRIIGICPVRYDENKELFVPMFWIYYPACREWLNSFAAINTRNTAEDLTFDELFIKRKFTSYIRKESNIYDRSIEEYATGEDALLESESIKNQLLRFEHNMWQY